MSTLHETVADMLSSLLNTIYPNVVFDTPGIARMLAPCLLALAAALVIYLLMKIIPRLRRFAYIPVAAVLIALIAFSAFLPVTRSRAGDAAIGWLQGPQAAQTQTQVNEPGK